MHQLYDKIYALSKLQNKPFKLKDSTAYGKMLKDKGHHKNKIPHGSHQKSALINAKAACYNILLKSILFTSRTNAHMIIYRQRLWLGADDFKSFWIEGEKCATSGFVKCFRFYSLQECEEWLETKEKERERLWKAASLAWPSSFSATHN